VCIAVANAAALSLEDTVPELKQALGQMNLAIVPATSTATLTVIDAKPAGYDVRVCMSVCLCV
jgi:hypothetical protein